MKRKKRALIIISVIAVLSIAAYIILTNTILADDEEQATPLELKDGEVADGKDIMMFEKISTATMKSLEVKNSYGKYKFVYDDKRSTFVLEGSESAVYDQSSFSTLVVNAGYSIVSARLDDPSDDLSIYGLKEGEEAAEYTIKTRTGKSYTVRIGSLVPTGTGYYAKLDGRDYIYTVSTSVSCLFVDKTAFISTTLAYPISSSDYQNVDNFRILRDGEDFIWIDTVQPQTPDGEYSYILKVPDGYTLNIAAYSAFLEHMNSFTGEAVVDFGGDAPLKSEYLKEKYGIDTDKPYYMLCYTVSSIPTCILFSEPDEKGYMYAYSMLYDIVAVVDCENADFLFWDRVRYIDNRVIGFMISDLAHISVKGNIENGDERLEVDESFTLKNIKASSENEKDTLLVTRDKTGESYDYDSVERFRNYYRTMISIYLQGTSDKTDISEMKKLATVTIKKADTVDAAGKKVSGEENEYVFYSYSTGRCFFTLNGNGEFFVPRKEVEKLLRDTNRFVSGQAINYDSDY